MSDSLRKRVLWKYSSECDSNKCVSRWQAGEADRYLIDLLGKELLQNDDFVNWFFRDSEQFGMTQRSCRRAKARLMKKVEHTEKILSVKPGSKGGIGRDTKEKVMLFWKKYSTISADRRTGRNEVFLKKARFDNDYRLAEFDDEEVEIVEKSYRKQKIQYMKAERRVYTGTIASLVTKFNDLNPSHKVSKNFFFLNKPFYVKEPTRREKQECLCSTCFNCHQVYKAYCKRDQLESLTKFLSKNLCTTYEDGRFADSCIKGICKNEGCKTFRYECDDTLESTEVQFYIFAVVEEEYKGKDGTIKKKKRSARVDISESSNDVGKRLEKLTAKYLLHKNRIFNHDTYFPQLEQSGKCMITQDWSENIQEKTKFEVQSAHFSGKQIVLHCSIVHKAEENQYIYHFSDHKSKDWATGKWILNDIIDKFLTDDDIEILRKTDNCREQYKSRQVFGSIQSLANDQKRTFKLVYGPPGHGRGLIDAMGAFGVKSVLRKHILDNDINLDSAKKMVSYFKDHNKSGNRHYFLIDDIEVERIRKEELTELPIKGNTRCPEITFLPDSEKVYFNTYLCGCPSIIPCDHSQSLRIDSLDHEEDEVSRSNEIDDCHEFDEEEDNDKVRREVMWASIEADQFIVSPSFSSFESFYISKVIDKKINSTDEIVEDNLGHTVAPGQYYLVCQYYEKGETNFRKKYIRYKKSKIAYVYIDPKLLICPFVQVLKLGKNYFDIDLEEYLSIKY